MRRPVRYKCGVGVPRSTSFLFYKDLQTQGPVSYKWEVGSLAPSFLYFTRIYKFRAVLHTNVHGSGTLSLSQYAVFRMEGKSEAGANRFGNVEESRPELETGNCK